MEQLITISRKVKNSLKQSDIVTLNDQTIKGKIFPL